MKEIKIYTDGGCSGNPGPGGWAAVILDGGSEYRYHGGAKLTTNNRMELLAAINGLKQSKQFLNSAFTVYTDSQYLQKGITEWIRGWKARGWKTSGGDPVKNKDLWVELDDLNKELCPSWEWVKGHAGDTYNEICDALTQAEIEIVKGR